MRKCLTKKIRQLRIENKLTIQELADRLKIPASSLGMYERGMRNPDVELVMKIATIFNVDIKCFYDESHTIKGVVRNINQLENDFEIKSAKKRAGEFCELCNKIAPFFLEDGTPYLEPYEINLQGERVSIVMLCPNCKRKIEILKYSGDINYLKHKVESERVNE